MIGYGQDLKIFHFIVFLSILFVIYMYCICIHMLGYHLPRVSRIIEGNQRKLMGKKKSGEEKKQKSRRKHKEEEKEEKEERRKGGKEEENREFITQRKSEDCINTTFQGA